ncbi:MAG: GNAT family N-acetyltransferase [Chryseobacterium sp.]|jgi:GNAT superfamily N-acetyltransferase|uniref:GNAT family N-acetyltransferase n=1 Tax=Chryseobacterium sp. TaxID=1871047 RepID=UPI00281AB487|nr:GNAT family N-acetyltransferase [Chryseobacterium sp.]MDR2235588.1 GNAT family N-acetyltransferase [Chryseobacterium sp.]
MIQLKTFNRKELEDFMASGDFRSYSFLPITEHRAASQIRNPKASDEQTLLILAFDEGQLAGYAGCFPDHFTAGEKVIPYAWLSTLFVHPDFRKKRVAKILLKKVIEEYQGRIAITEFTAEAEALYNIMGVFEYVFPKEGKRYYFRTDAAHLIPEKKPDVKSLKPLFKVMDVAANSLISVKNIGVKKPDFKYEILDRIDAESADFMASFSGQRNAEEINVFIDHPWILEGKKDNRYLFSSFAEVFKYLWIKLYDENNTLSACFLLQLRDGYLKIPYLFSNEDQDRVVRFLSFFIVKHKIKGFTCYQTALNDKIKKSAAFPKIYERGFKREYLFHQQLLESLPEGFDPHYQDGDGDCMMT